MISVTMNCGGTLAENCTYFDSSTTVVPGACKAKICKCNNNICQIRLDFRWERIQSNDLKFRFSEKATKIWKILPLVVTLLSKRQSMWKIFSNFCGFLKMSLVEFNYRYFKHLEITHLKKPMTASLSISPMFILHPVSYLI